LDAADDVRVVGLPYYFPSFLRLFRLFLAVAYDSTFCRDNNNNENTANARVQSVIARTSSHYQQEGLCLQVQVSYLEANCNPNTDPYEDFVADNNSICNAEGSIYEEFIAYWKTNRGNVRRDIAHLFYGNKASPNGGVIGCAALASLCSLTRGYGVNEIMFSDSLARQSTLLSHELGHSSGSSHDETGGVHIMSPYLCNCEVFSPSSVQQITQFVKGASCVQGPSPGPGPAPSPTPFPLPGFQCFSGSNTVQVQGRGLVQMDSVRIGDYVSAGKNRFSRVYSFGHIDRDAETEYHQIYANGLERPLEVSSMHMVFVNGRMRPASHVKTGDMLGKYKVLNVKMVKRRGLYAPFTESGDIVVSGVLVSSYITILDHTPINQHFASHAALAPFRLACYFDFGSCKNETYTDGLSDFIYKLAKIAEKFRAMSAPVQVSVSLGVLPLVVTAYMVEQLILSPIILIGLLIVGAVVCRSTKKSYYAHERRALAAMSGTLENCRKIEKLS
jgi:hypothetical protein